MNEQNRQIGQRIRSLRQRRDMTQSALAGDCITRNMLSLIESGNAAPSLHTLAELAHRLDIPVGYFFADDDAEISQFEKMSILAEIQRTFKRHDYQACLEVCSTLSSPDEEIRFIMHRCHFAMAEKALYANTLVTATTELEQAITFADGCIYVPDTFTPTSDYLIRLIHAAGREDIPTELADPGLFQNSLIPSSFFAYIRALIALKQNDLSTALALRNSGLIVSQVYIDFINAKCALMAHDTSSAMQMLKHVLAARPGFFSQYHVLSALETCAGTEGDFKSAYEYSTQKVRLLEHFSK